MLDRANVKRLIPFQEWWETEIVCLAEEGVQMTRKSIILGQMRRKPVANKTAGRQCRKIIGSAPLPALLFA